MDLIERRFMFHGSVVGLAGHIRRPQDRILAVKGSAAVPSTGGYAHVEHPGEHIPGLFSFSSISSWISADYADLNQAMERTHINPSMAPPLPAITRVHTRVQNLAIEQRLTVEKIELSLSSIHSGSAPAVFSSRGSAILGLRLDGYLLSVHLDNDLFSGPLSTEQGICALYKQDEKFQDRIISDPDQKRDDSDDGPPRLHGYIGCSLVRSLEWEGDKNPRAQIIGTHIVHLDDFGYIYLGEMLTTPEYRQVTLLRVQLGSPGGGDSTCGEGKVNGHDASP